MSKYNKYSFLVANRKTKDLERAVLPTILYAGKSDNGVTSKAITIGWWAWGVGILHTKVKS